MYEFISNYGGFIIICVGVVSIAIIFKLFAEDGFKKEHFPIDSYKLNDKSNKIG